MKQDNIINIVAEYHNLNSCDLLGKSRLREHAEARHIAIYLIKQVLNPSWMDIARKFHRDHSTIIKAYETTHDLITTYSDFANKIEVLKNLVSIDQRKKLVYISAPIIYDRVGNLVTEHFDKAETVLLAKGYNVLNPLKCGDLVNRKKHILSCDMIAVRRDMIITHSCIDEAIVAHLLFMKIIDCFSEEEIDFNELVRL